MSSSAADARRPHVVHCIRHAQGLHNLSHLNHSLPDPVLTPKGEAQCRSLRGTFPTPLKSGRLRLILASPLKRTISTALIAFDPILKNPETGKNMRRGLTVLAVPDLQETSDYPCDVGSNLNELRQHFANHPIDFGLLEQAGGEAWFVKKDVQGISPQAVKDRAERVRDYIFQKVSELESGAEVAVVTHGGFLHYLTEDWSDFNGVNGTGWMNTEVRSYTFAPKGDQEHARLIETEQCAKRRRATTSKSQSRERSRKLGPHEPDSARAKASAHESVTDSQLRALERQRDWVGGYGP